MPFLTLTSAETNIVLDGNSIMAGSQVPNPADHIDAVLTRLAPLAGTGMTVRNLANGGATFQTMISGQNGSSSISEVHTAFASGKQNILFILEGRNTVDYPRSNGAACTAADIATDCKAYITAVHAVHPEWRVYILTAPAYQVNYPADTVGNAALDGFNDYLRSHYADLGAEGFVEIRPTGGPLAFPPPYTYSETNFTKSGLYGDATHPNAAGTAVIAQYMADKLAVIPAVAPSGTPAPAPTGARFLMAGTKLFLVNGQPLRVN